MTVLQLEGESAQLRQVARLYANGDITLDDYRNIRTVMIDAFVADLETSLEPVAASATRSPAPAETLIPLEIPLPAAAAVATRTHAGANGPPAAESPAALLAILGAGAMLLIVAMLAIGLG